MSRGTIKLRKSCKTDTGPCTRVQMPDGYSMARHEAPKHIGGMFLRKLATTTPSWLCARRTFPQLARSLELSMARLHWWWDLKTRTTSPNTPTRRLDKHNESMEHVYLSTPWAPNQQGGGEVCSKLFLWVILAPRAAFWHSE